MTNVLIIREDRRGETQERKSYKDKEGDKSYAVTSQKTAWSYQEPEETRKDFPLEFRGSVALAAP